jgi:hypothetical protein
MNDHPPSPAALREHASELRLHGLLAHWAEVMGQPEHARWVAQMLAWEAAERSRRSLERRLREAHIGRFKPLADFDWAWPKSIDRGAVDVVGAEVALLFGGAFRLRDRGFDQPPKSGRGLQC